MTVAEDATDTAAPPKTRFTSFRPLRHRQFALVWSAALVSNATSTTDSSPSESSPGKL